MRDLILQALNQVVKEHPEILPYLSKSTKKILDDGIEWHQKFKRHDPNYNYAPDEGRITQKDIDEAIKTWNKLMPEFKGMLDAEVEIEE